MKENDTSKEESRSFGEAVEWMMRRFRSSGELVRGAAAAGAIALASGQVLSGCATDVVGAAEAELINSNIQSWAQQRGTRTTSMVRYDQKYWSQVTGCGFRGGCTDYEFFVQLFVQPVEGANLDDKKVGVVYRLPGYREPQTATGYYVRTFDDGREEWHVPVRVRSWDGSIFTFDAWYEDGTWFYDEGAGEWRKRTWVDDNGGDLYPASIGPWSVVSRWWTPEGQVTVGQDGVHGILDFRVANLDWDKELAMVWTTDGWATTNVSGMGSGPNQFRFVNPLEPVIDGQHDFEHWRIELDIPGETERFEYAIVYRHGFAEGATQSEVWDNNGGQNYAIVAEQPF